MLFIPRAQCVADVCKGKWMNEWVGVCQGIVVRQCEIVKSLEKKEDLIETQSVSG